MRFIITWLILSLRAFGLMMGYDWFLQDLIPGAGEMSFLDAIGLFFLASVAGKYQKPTEMPMEDLVEAGLILGFLIIAMFVFHLIATVNISFN